MIHHIMSNHDAHHTNSFVFFFCFPPSFISCFLYLKYGFNDEEKRMHGNVLCIQTHFAVVTLLSLKKNFKLYLCKLIIVLHISKMLKYFIHESRFCHCIASFILFVVDE